MKKTMFTSVVCAALLSLGCNDKAIMDPVDLGYPDYAIVDGDTIKTKNDKDKFGKFVYKHSEFGTRYPITGDTIVVAKNIKLPKASKVAKLDNLKNNEDKDLKGKPLKMVVVGGAVAAGFRDAGWFNEGMITSYPNIIANQMGISLDLPLFDADEYNGMERKVYTKYNPTGGPVPKIKSVTNNSGLYPSDVNKDKFKGKPISKNTDTYVRPINSSYDRISKKDVVGSNSISRQLYLDFKKGKKYDFFILDPVNWGDEKQPPSIMEIDLEYLKLRDYKKFPEDGFESWEINKFTLFQTPPDMDNLVRRLANIKFKNGVLVNRPDIYKYSGYYTKNYKEELVQLMKTYQISNLYTSGDPINSKFEYNMPTVGGYTHALGSSAVDSLLGKNVNINIKPGVNKHNPIRSQVEIGNFERESIWHYEDYNKALRVYSEYLNVPIFDLNGLYKKIWEGSYTTDDGVKVSGRWPEGNFFSVDGIYPSAFGQAVIANELIKFINSQYKSDIPLVRTADFLKF
ncbi:MAG: hypothetical protein ACRCVT_10835 [Leadbetterella sp.]